MIEMNTARQEELKEKALEYIHLFFEEVGGTDEGRVKRETEILHEIEETGTYTHTFEELEYGAKVAWRNSNRCIGRLFWNTMKVRDARYVEHTDQVFDELTKHVQFATNEGKIKPTITIFPPSGKVRIWNHQLARYAGEETEHGVLGDRDSVEFTKVCQELGWKGPSSHFDLLPWVVQMEGEAPVWKEVSSPLIKEVEITHPEIAGLQDLQLKWYAVPMIADMNLEIGGIDYQAAPFNGWYMGTEIGARNLADDNRYNMLPKVASIMGLDTSKAYTLWKDKALVELNVAVLHSYKEAGVSIVDHHTAAQQFKIFEQNEQQAGREVTGDWVWLIPPVSPATTHIFHKPYKRKWKSPNYYYQENAYTKG